MCIRDRPNEVLKEEIRLAKIYSQPHKSVVVNTENFSTVRGSWGCRHGTLATLFTDTEVEELLKIQKEAGLRYYR